MILLGRRAWGLLEITLILAGTARWAEAAPRAAAPAGGEQTLVDFGQLRPDAIKTRDMRTAPLAAGSDLRLRILAGHKQEWPAVLVHPPQDVWNLQQRQYVAVDVRNAGREPVTPGCGSIPRGPTAASQARRPGSISAGPAADDCRAAGAVPAGRSSRASFSPCWPCPSAGGRAASSIRPGSTRFPSTWRGPRRTTCWRCPTSAPAARPPRPLRRPAGISFR